MTDSTTYAASVCFSRSRSTGKERDTESGNDYFEARYYSSAMGRFMSPDWSAKEEPVPYATMDDPQSLNLYSYVRNNPLAKADPDGHCPECVWEEIADSPEGQAVGDLIGAGVAAGTSAVLAFGKDVFDANVNQGGPASTGMYPTTMNSSNSNAPAPTTPAPTTGATPLPTGLVGTDPSPTKGRTNSGPLAPENGGSGDAGKDFGTLTGGKSGPAASGSTYPPGTQVGDNGTALRPASGKSGPRIDIPANGSKPHETLHYPPPPPPPTQPKP